MGGKFTYDDIMQAGKTFVGKDTKLVKHADGTIKEMISKNGLRRFRTPKYKPRVKVKQANFETKASTNVHWNKSELKTNVHVNSNE